MTQTLPAGTLAIALLAAMPASAAPVEPAEIIFGQVLTLDAPDGFDGSFADGALLSGTAEFDFGSPGCEEACEVTSLAIAFDDVLLIDVDTSGGALSLDLLPIPNPLSGTASLGDAFGLTSVTARFGALADGPFTFAFDAEEANGFATGVIEVDSGFVIDFFPPPVPLPASLPLMLAVVGLGAGIAARRVRG